MKKTIIFLLVCATVLAFAACGDKKVVTTQTTQASVQEPDNTPSGDTTGKEDTTIPGEQGVEDSIFDGPSQGVERTEPVEESTDAETKPQEQETEATVPSPTEDEPLTYEQWLELTPAQQRQYEESFPTRDAFFDWYEAAKKAYDEANPPIEIGSGSIDMSTMPT